MCGRYALYGFPPILQAHFKTQNELDFTPHFNITPTQTVPIVRTNEVGQRIISLARWGLIPSWINDSTEVQHPINAKAETAAIKPMFRHAFRKSRILVPADGFYEWQPVADGKQPWLIHRNR
jgi:putative SOS response-associated peptidase YedK